MSLASYVRPHQCTHLRSNFMNMDMWTCGVFGSILMLQACHLNVHIYKIEIHLNIKIKIEFE